MAQRDVTLEDIRLMCGNAAFFLKSAQKLKWVHAAEIEHLDKKESHPDAMIPMIYLVSHSIEIILKAFLLHKNFDHNALKHKDMRHDISRLYDESVKLGLDVNYTNISQLIPILSDMHKKHTLRYYNSESEFGYLLTDKKGMVFFIDEPIRLWKNVMRQIGMGQRLDSYLKTESVIATTERNAL
jgi:hypothetical protein